MEYKSFKTFNQDYLNTLKELEYRERFLALYPYLKDYLMPAMRYKRFGNVDYFDWEDACSAVYYNIFILCSNSDWLSKHPNQVKRFLYVVCQNSVLRQLQLLNRYRSRNVSIDSIENFEGILDVIPDTNNKINIIDVVEVNGLRIERQLIRTYERLLGSKGLNNACRTVIKRYARIIAGRIAEDQRD